MIDVLDKVAEQLDIAIPRDSEASDDMAGEAVMPLGPRARAKRHRRAVILAAARALFNEGGSSNVTIRSLAMRSGITAPTIYKLVGGRDVVLEQALLEVLFTCVGQARTVAECHEVNIICGFIETLWLMTERHPAYSRYQVDLNWRTPGGRRVGAYFRETSTATIANWLSAICDPLRLSQIGGARAVANAIQAHIRITFIDWSAGCTSMSRLHYDLALGAAIILTGLLDNAEQWRLQRWLVRLRMSAERP